MRSNQLPPRIHSARQSMNRTLPATKVRNYEALRAKFTRGFTPAEIADFFGIRRAEAIRAVLALKLAGIVEQLANRRWVFTGPTPDASTQALPPHVSDGLVSFLAIALRFRSAPK